jgi:hypothetical protein
LKQASAKIGGMSWSEPDANFGQYDKIILERILVTLHDQAQYKAADPVSLAKLVDEFRVAITKALQPKYPIVREPGPGVLVVRFTLTDLVPVNVPVDLAHQAVPFGILVELAEGPASGQPFGSAPYLGHTGVVAQLYDSGSGRLLGEYVDNRIGQQFVADLSKGISAGFDEGVQQYARGVTPWGYAEKAFIVWAQAFREWLDNAHRS